MGGFRAASRGSRKNRLTRWLTEYFAMDRVPFPRGRLLPALSNKTRESAPRLWRAPEVAG
ncbi:hypothetical protein GCM10009837_74010 [Streptomyces durmitorensis]